jgi:RNA polymerase sigma-70 factor (ECF subfamily)
VTDKTLTLEELMRLAQNGDKSAYAHLFHSITPMIRSFVSKHLSNQSDAEDVVQNILLSIHRASNTYDTDRPFKVWMFTIARYRLNDHLRLHYKKAGVPEVSFDILNYEISAEDVTKTNEDREYLNEMLQTLPEKQRKIITMMKLEGHTAKFTAKTLNMTTSAVKVSAHRAYKMLAQKAHKEDQDE